MPHLCLISSGKDKAEAEKGPVFIELRWLSKALLCNLFLSTALKGQPGRSERLAQCVMEQVRAAAEPGLRPGLAPH